MVLICNINTPLIGGPVTNKHSILSSLQEKIPLNTKLANTYLKIMDFRLMRCCVIREHFQTDFLKIVHPVHTLIQASILYAKPTIYHEPLQNNKLKFQILVPPKFAIQFHFLVPSLLYSIQFTPNMLII